MVLLVVESIVLLVGESIISGSIIGRRDGISSSRREY